MKRTYLILLMCFIALLPLRLIAAIDMQAHVGSDEGKAAYTDYIAEQNAYYTGNYAYSSLISLTNDALFGRLNARMGDPCRLNQTGYNYNKLRDYYKTVDRDLNKDGYIIGYYDGSSMNGTWDGGTTYNREHTWPQSKGADDDIDMGHDMQSVRPANASINSGRGNAAYGEGDSYYNPDTDKKINGINNTFYKSENLGTYRGDCARVIMYDYLMYGETGGYKNSYHNGEAQLLSKLGTDGVFESLHIMLKWHMQDPPSLTEMVRNDGAQDYQGNRNPLIDYPELAIQVFLDDGITTYSVTESSTATMWPAHRYTLTDGFIAYLTNGDGTHPADIQVTGATYTYDKSLGRLTVSNVTGNMTISDVAGSTPEPEPDPDPSIYTVTWMANGEVHATATYNANGTETIQLPAAPAACDGYTFVGWTTQANYANPFCKPSDLFTSATHKVNSNLTYYAVFKKD
jgi:uncharacterized repeat protein (TIGR02543 family)